MTTLESAAAQMRANGMPEFPAGIPRVNSPRINRYGPKNRAWYRLFEFTGRDGRSFVTGAYGMWGAIEATKIESDWSGMDDAERTRIQAAQQAAEQREREKRAHLAAFAALRGRRDYRHALTDGPCPYLERKRVTLEQPLRVLQNGTLIVPAYRYDEQPPRLVGVQKIAADGAKRFNKGMAKAGAACRLGRKPKDAETVLVCEGVATGLSIRAGVDHAQAVFVAFDAGNLEAVAKIVRAQMPNSRIVLCADDDWQSEGNPGRMYAERAAAKVGNAVVVAPKFQGARDPKATDFNDLHCAEGVESVRSQIHSTAVTQQLIGAGTGDGGASDELPAIEIVPGKMTACVDAVQAALLARRAPIYQMGGALVRVVETEANGDPLLRPRVILEDGPHLAETVTGHCVLLKAKASPGRKPAGDSDGKGRSSALVRVDCPRAVVDTLISRAEWRFPHMRGLLFAPTVRRDGSILDAPGFDAATGLFLAGGLDIRGHLRERLDLAAAKDAADWLLTELLDEFPFGHGNAVAALALLITALVRRGVSAAPGFGITAPAPGSGKSYLAEATNIIATGAGMNAVTRPRTPEEELKTIASLLIESVPIISYDNLEEPLGSDVLCSMLTQSFIQVRLLGLNRTVTLPTSALLIATGNNLTIVGDMVRRIVGVHLVPKEERPETRTFSRDLLAFIRANRAEIVARLLTIPAAYLRHGCPPVDLPPVVGFEEWSTMVRAPLAWIGLGDACATMSEFAATDPVRQQLGSLLVTWYARHGSVPMTVREALDVPDGELRQAALEIAERNGTISFRVLGKFIGKCAERWERGLRFLRVRDSRDGVGTWRVEATNRPAESA